MLQQNIKLNQLKGQHTELTSEIINAINNGTAYQTQSQHASAEVQDIEPDETNTFLRTKRDHTVRQLSRTTRILFLLTADPIKNTSHMWRIFLILFGRAVPTHDP